MNDPKDHPRASEPAGEQPSDATQPVETPAAASPPQTPPAPPPAEEQQTAALPQQPPAGQAPPPYPYAPPPPARPGRFRRASRNRAVQLVVVGVLGLVIGGGIVGGAVAIAGSGSHGPRDGRPGISQNHNPRGGPGGFGGSGRNGGPRTGQGPGQGAGQGT
jgi:hypothetical protein